MICLTHMCPHISHVFAISVLFILCWKFCSLLSACFLLFILRSLVFYCFIVNLCCFFCLSLSIVNVVAIAVIVVGRGGYCFIQWLTELFSPTYTGLYVRVWSCMCQATRRNVWGIVSWVVKQPALARATSSTSRMNNKKIRYFISIRF